jgi:hypothetical protein
MTLAIFVTALLGAVVVAVDPARAGAALTPILLLQLFASASGFMVPARRGHYDLLLTTGHGAMEVAATHWMMSTAPGLASWLGLALVELVATGGAAATLLASGSMAAMLLVSSVPWAATIALPRFAGAVSWLVALTFLAVTTANADGTVVFSASGTGSSAVEALARTLYPPLLVGEQFRASHWHLLVPAVALSAVTPAWALLWVRRQDTPLEAAQ